MTKKCMINQRRVQKYSNEMLWDLFNQAVDFYRSHCPTVIILTQLHFNLQDKFMCLFIQVKNSAIRHVNQNEDLRPVCSCTQERCMKCRNFLLRISETRKGHRRYFTMLINIKYVEQCRMYRGRGTGVRPRRSALQ